MLGLTTTKLEEEIEDVQDIKCFGWFDIVYKVGEPKYVVP